MATYEAKILVPRVPEHLTVKLPGQARGSTVRVQDIDDEMLRQVASEWGDNLIKLAQSKRSSAAAGKKPATKSAATNAA